MYVAGIESNAVVSRVFVGRVDSVGSFPERPVSGIH